MSVPGRPALTLTHFTVPDASLVLLRELKKAQLARAAAEEKVLSTDRVLTRSTLQSNPRTTRLIGKKINRSVSLTIY